MVEGTKTFRVLSLDGGGIRGIIPLGILAFIEEETQGPVSELFDLVVGTSTGGILSLALTAPDTAGKPKFSASDLDTLYCTDAARIFKPWDSSDLAARLEDIVADGLGALEVIDRAETKSLHEGNGKPVPWWKGLFRPKYTAEGLEAFLRGHLGECRLSGPVAGTFVAVNSFDLDSYTVKMFRSWEAANTPDQDFASWAVGRATSAAPTFFPPAAIESLGGGTLLHCVDGGVAVNDPVLVGYAEARQLLRARFSGLGEAPILVVSIGTGQPPNQSIRYADVRDTGILGWFTHGLIDVLLDGTNVAANQIADVLLPKGSFYRFQPPLSGPGFAASDAMDDWSEENIRNLNAAVDHYLRENEAIIRAAIEELKGGGGLVA